MNVQTYSETRAKFKASMESVADRHEPLLIKGKSTDVVMIAREDFESMQETLHLLGNKKNADRLMTSIASYKNGSTTEVDFFNDEDKEEAG